MPLVPRVVTAAVWGMTATVKPSRSRLDDRQADAVHRDRALLDDVAQQARRRSDSVASSRASSRRATGSVAAINARTNAWLNAEWRNLSEQLTVLASLRRQHHATGNQKGNGTPKSSQYRDAGLASPIGARVVAADLFDELFGRMELTPSEMAARLLEREIQRQLHTLQETSAPRSRRGLGSFTAAAAAVTALALFPRWRNVYRGLRGRLPTPPSADSPRN